MNQEKINDLVHKVMDIKQDTQQVLDEISSMESAYEEQTGREQALEAENAKLREHKERLTGLEIQLRDKNQGLYDDKAMLEREVAELNKHVEFYTKKYNELAQQKDAPTMPVIPKDVAIAIFREGIKQGVEDACCELDNSDSVEIEESGYTGGFEVSFSKCVDLTDYLDTDWMRSKVGNYDELNVTNALMGLCETKGFECRIHGIDENK